MHIFVCFPGGANGKKQNKTKQKPACHCRRHERLSFNPWVRKIPWRRTWQSTPVEESIPCLENRMDRGA